MNNETSLKKIRIKKGIYVLPNLFTTASLFAGFYSIISSLQEKFTVAAAAILVSLVLDSLDGRIARMTNTTSKFGAEYDSLADLVAFGVAPALLAYIWSMSFFGRWGWIAAFMFVLCGALRLARFNIQIGIIESKVFNGLPIPAAAAFVSTTVIFFHYLGVEGKFENLCVLFFVIILSLLMVSNVKYYSGKDMKLFARKPFMSFLLLVILLIVIYAEKEIMPFVLMAAYVISGPIWWVIKFRRQLVQKAQEKNTNQQEQEQQEAEK